MIHDDLTTEDAANSPAMMQAAIQWHSNSHALLSEQATDLVFVTGTRWSVADLPDHIMTNQPEYEVNTDWRGLVEDGRIIYPIKFGYEDAVAKLRAQHGSMFPLLYFNRVEDSGLVDFDAGDLRTFEIVGESLRFTGDPRDTELSQEINRPIIPHVVPDLSRIRAPVPADYGIPEIPRPPTHVGSALALARKRVLSILGDQDERDNLRRIR
jgi:hypothetical protein